MSKKNLFRAFTVAGVTAAFLGSALIPGIVAPKSAIANDNAPLIETGATVWKYNDTNTDPAAGQSDRLAWTKDGFQIPATWKEAKGAFGFKTKKGKDDKKEYDKNVNGYTWSTLLPASPTGPDSDNTKTYHFVTTVNVTKAQLDAAAKFRATVKIDDSAQIFVNGEKVDGIFDENIEAAPEKDRNLMYVVDGGGAPVDKTFEIPKNKLKEGKNTIAVAVYQADAKSSDIYFDFLRLVPVTAAEDAMAKPKALVQTVGKTAADRNFTWYTLYKQVDQELQYALKSEVKDGAFPAGAKTVKAKSDNKDVSTAQFLTPEYNYRVSIEGLKENSEYVYRVGNEKTGWSELHSFKTPKFSGDYSFLFFGDPQVGASKNLKADEEGWIDTINLGVKTYPNTELLFSAGDQVEDAPNEDEYDAFLAPKQMRSLPLVPVIGNHDVYSKAFDHHFTVPNLDQNYGAGCATYKRNCPSETDYSSGNYYFEYKGTLFVVLNSNVNSPEGIKQHNEFLEKAVKAHPNAKWKAVGFHHSVYSVAVHAVKGKSGDVEYIDKLRGGAFGAEKMKDGITGKIAELGFNFVLMGHDHSYVRTYLLNQDGVKSNPTEKEGQAEVTAKHGEVLYITGNSASGSKFYGQELRLASDNSEKNGKLPVAPYASVINQETLRNYTNIDVQECKLTFTTLVSGKHKNTTKADQVKNDGINHVVDKVTVHKPNCTEKPADQKPADPKQPETKPITKPVDPKQTDAKLVSSVNGVKAGGDEVSVKAGSQIEFKAVGFGPGEKVEVVVHSKPIKLGTFTADKDGVVQVAWTVPADFEAGKHKAVFTGLGSGKVVELPFTVTKEAGKDAGKDALANTGADMGALFGGAIALTLAGATGLAVARRRQA